MGSTTDRSFLGFSVASKWDYENGYYLTSGVERIGKLACHLDLYRRIVGLPGHVVECGVFKGASLIRWATFRRLFEADHSRTIFGFDAFGDFPRPRDEADQAYAARFSEVSGRGISIEELQASLDHKTLNNVVLVPGDLGDTLPKVLSDRPELRVALLHLDMDVYEPTALALELLLPRVVPGGLVVVDDYNAVAGATRAVDEVVAEFGYRLEKLPYAHVPAFFVKP